MEEKPMKRKKKRRHEEERGERDRERKHCSSEDRQKEKQGREDSCSRRAKTPKATEISSTISSTIYSIISITNDHNGSSSSQSQTQNQTQSGCWKHTTTIQGSVPVKRNRSKSRSKFQSHASKKSVSLPDLEITSTSTSASTSHRNSSESSGGEFHSIIVGNQIHQIHSNGSKNKSKHKHVRNKDRRKAEKKEARSEHVTSTHIDIQDQEPCPKKSESEIKCEFEKREQDLTEEPELEAGTVTINHPLLIPEILELIFDYLSVSTSSSCPSPADDNDHDALLSCQNVCSLWNEIITKRMESMERYPVEIPSKLSSFDHRFKKIVQSIPKHRSSFSVHTMPNNFMQYFCKKIGPQMKSLHISLTCVVDKSNCHFIEFISKYCLKLDELSIDLSDCRLSIFDEDSHHSYHHGSLNVNASMGPVETTSSSSWRKSSNHQQYYLKIRKLSTQDNRIFRNNRILKRLPIALSPFLQTLSFTGNSDQLIFILKTISKSAQDITKLTSLEFYSCSTLPLDDNFIQFFLSQRWALKSFKLRFRHNVQIRNARVLFNHLKDSLVDLIVEFDNPEINLDLPIEQNFLIPLSMPKLKRIEVNEQSTLSLINALHLPTLKSCVCYYSVLGKGDLFNKILLENPPKFSQYGHSLETLTIYENSIDLPVFVGNNTTASSTNVILSSSSSNNNCVNLENQNFESLKSNPFTNLKNLHLEHATHTMLQVILANHANIERLKLCNLYSLSGPAWDWNSNSKIDVSDRSIDWDELITGVGKPFFDWGLTATNNKKATAATSRASGQLKRLRQEVGGGGGGGEDGTEIQSTSKINSKFLSNFQNSDRDPDRPLKRIGPSITDLKKLKYLSIAFETTACKLTDFTIYNGLMHLTDLQFLELNQQKFTTDAVAALQEKLLPFCRVILNT